MLRSLIAAAAVTVCATVAFAETDVVSHRIELMKNAGDATKPVADMLKGAAPFDIEKVKAALASYEKAAKEYPSLYPENSKEGKDTTASPKIWENKADFDAKLAAWGKASADASAKITDEASFKSEIKTVLGACKGCHDDYRIKK
ncbi:cytochrome c [Microvirga sp. W0021]|uniref:Cytochrome c n=1 Tax=Hohaiivirga grylli TaxID=3133970 RepID=A0ABV0BKX3_9HYPH